MTKERYVNSLNRFKIFVLMWLWIFSFNVIGNEEVDPVKLNLLNERISELENRIKYQEEVEAVKRAVLRYGRWVDKVMSYDKEDDFAYMANELHTKDGQVVHSSGAWGPEKDDLINRIRKHSAPIDWSIHYYTNVEAIVDMETNTARYRALELVPQKRRDGTATWAWVANDSLLRKVDNEWKFVRYGPAEVGRLKQTINSPDDWPAWETQPNWLNEWP
jgi:hypothetical protein